MYTEKQLQRCSRITGPVTDELERLFSEKLGSEKHRTGYSRHYVEFKDVMNFTANYAKDGLFDYVPGRCHTGFENFRHEWNICNPEKFFSKLELRSRKLDLWRNFNYAN